MHEIKYDGYRMHAQIDMMELRNLTQSFRASMICKLPGESENARRRSLQGAPEGR